jgi:hypothetical protein
MSKHVTICVQDSCIVQVHVLCNDRFYDGGASSRCPHFRHGDAVPDNMSHGEMMRLISEQDDEFRPHPGASSSHELLPQPPAPPPPPPPQVPPQEMEQPKKVQQAFWYNRKRGSSWYNQPEAVPEPSGPPPEPKQMPRHQRQPITPPDAFQHATQADAKAAEVKAPAAKAPEPQAPGEAVDASAEAEENDYWGKGKHWAKKQRKRERRMQWESEEAERELARQNRRQVEVFEALRLQQRMNEAWAAAEASMEPNDAAQQGPPNIVDTASQQVISADVADPWYCQICMTTIEISEEYIICPCTHKFHRFCIEPWWLDLNAKKCATCRMVADEWVSGFRPALATRTNQAGSETAKASLQTAKAAPNTAKASSETAKAEPEGAKAAAQRAKPPVEQPPIVKAAAELVQAPSAKSSVSAAAAPPGWHTDRIQAERERREKEEVQNLELQNKRIDKTLKEVLEERIAIQDRKRKVIEFIEAKAKAKAKAPEGAASSSSSSSSALVSSQIAQSILEELRVEDGPVQAVAKSPEPAPEPPKAKSPATSSDAQGSTKGLSNKRVYKKRPATEMSSK